MEEVKNGTLSFTSADGRDKEEMSVLGIQIFGEGSVGATGLVLSILAMFLLLSKRLP